MFTRDSISTKDEVDEEGAGITLADIGQSIMIWAVMNYGRDLSVAECASVFNTTPDIIKDSAAKIMWLCLVPENEPDCQKLFIEVDGD